MWLIFSLFCIDDRFLKVVLLYFCEKINMYDIIKSKCINIFVKVQILKTLSLNGVAFKSKRKPPDLQILVLVNWQFHFVNFCSRQRSDTVFKFTSSTLYYKYENYVIHVHVRIRKEIFFKSNDDKYLDLFYLIYPWFICLFSPIIDSITWTT